MGSLARCLLLPAAVGGCTWEVHLVIHLLPQKLSRLGTPTLTQQNKTNAKCHLKSPGAWQPASPNCKSNSEVYGRLPGTCTPS